MKHLVPSLLSADFYNLQNDLSLLIKGGIKHIHLDVMDGNFVPNISIGIPIIESLKKHVANNFVFDTHLMVEKPERYLEKFKNAGSDILTIHEEATSDYISVINEIKKLGMKAGISINPETDVRVIDKALNVADLVLVMSVHPGFGGQKFIEESLDKVRYLYDMRLKNKYNYVIEIDGGINANNIKSVLDAGVDYVVAGSSVFNGEIENNISIFNSIIGEYYE